MNFADYVILSLVGLLLIGAILLIIRMKKVGRHCGCGTCNGKCQSACRKHIKE